MIMVRLPPGTVARLKDRAVVEDRRPSEIMRRAIIRELDRPVPTVVYPDETDG
jgi:predicted transcriptional regulator